MAVVITGNNEFAARNELNRLVQEFVTKHGEFGVERIEAADIELGRLLENVGSAPFLASRRMIILSSPSSNKTVAEHIDQILDAASESTDLIISERKFDKRLGLYKTLKKRAEFKEYNDLDERGLAGWLVVEAKKRGGTLKNVDANFLVQRAGLNQMGLSHELGKLLSYDPSITRDNIELLIEPLPQSSVFDLLDAAFAGNKQRTIALYQDQRKQQVEPQAIMGMIAWQVHILAVVKFNEKDGAEAIAQKAKLSPFVVRKTLNITRSLSQKQTKDLVGRALALDIRLKSEMIDADDAVQHFLLTI